MHVEVVPGLVVEDLAHLGAAEEMLAVVEQHREQATSSTYERPRVYVVEERLVNERQTLIAVPDQDARVDEGSHGGGPIVDDRGRGGQRPVGAVAPTARIRPPSRRCLWRRRTRPAGRAAQTASGPPPSFRDSCVLLGSPLGCPLTPSCSRQVPRRESPHDVREPLEADVPLYLGRFKYSAEAIKAMIENPHDREAVAAEAAESLGCKLHGIWWAFGEHDGVFLLEAPDNVAVVALAMAVAASGQISTETTALLDMNEAQEAMRRAATATFRPPS